ncbi:hypothetical protein BXZ70DRAFT_1009863 [Cristinia sonorae]|uniref:Uncharacterized protein n=1 Tax=Cristinia sonorae TaxID=1940300 RepID=A0A8K0UL65_9AGAR|nr:hypothetical protein BXZ70DRAFT_1009863 [Cristinia sonorae]
MLATVRLLTESLPATWINYSTPRARNMVRKVLQTSTHPIGLTTKQIYAKIHELFPDEKQPAPEPFVVQPGMKGRYGQPAKPVPEPPKREHPIRSVKYLKKVVMEDMALEGEVEKVTMRRDADGVLRRIPTKKRMSRKKSQQDLVWFWSLVSPTMQLPQRPLTATDTQDRQDHDKTQGITVQNATL